MSKICECVDLVVIGHYHYTALTVFIFYFSMYYTAQYCTVKNTSIQYIDLAALAH